MEQTVVAYFDNRRDAELAVEHLIQERGIERTDIFLQAQGRANTAGIEAAGADVQSGHPGVEKRGAPKLDGQIELSVDCHGADRDKVLKTLAETGAKRVSLEVDRPTSRAGCVRTAQIDAVLSRRVRRM